MLTASLKLRLVLAASLWVVPILILSGALLLWLFESYVERKLDAEIAAYQHELIAAASIDSGGTFVFMHEPVNPRFNRPLSGWYWQAVMEGKIVAQSRSAGPGGAGGLAPLLPKGPSENLIGPGGHALRVATLDIKLLGAPLPVTIIVTAPVDAIDAEVRPFARQLIIVFSLLGAAFLIGVYLQVGFGLGPLATLKSRISAIRTGREERLTGDFPAEIAPLAEEVNALIEHNRNLIGRARKEAANLAHALKNPLAVIGQEIREIPDAQGAVLSEQFAVIAGYVEHMLKRIRAAGPSGAGREHAELAPLIEDLVFSLGLIHRQRALSFTTRIAPDLAFAGDAEDLAEMLGNLADNACKWAKSHVEISASRDGDRLIVAIEDDGPGIPPADRAQALERGKRLDERVPGSGLGLDIVNEIALLYRGRLELDASHLGGLKARLDLPSA